MKELAPIVVFVYNKLEETTKMMEALMNNTLAKESELFVFSDGPKSADGKNAVEEVRTYIHSNRIVEAFRTVTIAEAEQNKGLAESVITGVTQIMNRFGKVIVVEDDLVTSPCFLDYMNKALQYYESDESIWSVTGFSYGMPMPNGYGHDVFIHGRVSSYGWGTWKDRWDTVDWEVKTYPKFKHNFFERFQMGRWGSNLPEMLDAQMLSDIDSWAIRWCYSAIKQKKMTVYPVVSKIRIVDNSGNAHHGKVPSAFTDIVIDEHVTTCDKMEKVHLNREIVRLFNKLSPGKSKRNKIRWAIIRITGVKYNSDFFKILRI